MKNSIKLILLAIIVIPLLSITITTIDLENKSILDNIASIKLPNNFNKMTKVELINDFSYNERPIEAYRNKEKNIYLSFRLRPTFQGISQDKITEMKDYYIASNNHFGKCVDSGIFKNNNKKYAFVKVEGLKKGATEVYVIQFFSDINGHFLEGTFYCSANQKHKWKDTANEIMRSFKIK